MKRWPPKNQTGYALLVFVLAIMGAGGLLLVGFSEGMLESAEVKKFEHNKRVLKEAKQALLQFAYNYPVTNDKGPGRLPCADTDNDGIPNTCNSFGRFPWAQQNLNFYDVRDADGERLWYAVSSNFTTQATIVNSDTSGNITLRDQSGNIIYDGFNPGSLIQYGIAAVIIAPGAAIARNDGLVQDRTVANVNAEEHYLDDTGDEDNAILNLNLSGSGDGFILGPVPNLTNDQFIVITAAEVIEMAEKATLQAYRTAINDYLAQTGNVYPWLYNYVVPASEAISSYYPADPVWATELATNLDNFGRIPSILDEYFSETNSQPIETRLSGSISLDGPATVGGESILDGPTLDFQTTDKLTGVSFVDLATAGEGRLTGTMTSPETFTWEVYFWESDHGDPPLLFNGGWLVCANGADTLSDCNRDSAGNATTGANNIRLDIIHATITLDLSGVVNFDMDYTPAPAIVVAAATGTSHASITGTYAGANIISRPSLTATWERDQHYHEGESALVAGSSGTWNAAEMDNFASGPLSLELRFYPELPGWVFDNGWHDSVMMAYANDYRPDVNGAAGDCVTNPPCLQINGLGGINNDKVSILVIAGEHGWVDGDVDPVVAADGSFANDVGDVFNIENSDLDNILDMRTVEDTAAPGDAQLDKILIIEE